MQTGTDRLVNRVAEGTSRTIRIAGATSEGTRAVAVSATNSDRTSGIVIITTIVHSTLVNSSRVADGITNGLGETKEASSRMVLVLELKRRKSGL